MARDNACGSTRDATLDSSSDSARNSFRATVAAACLTLVAFAPAAMADLRGEIDLAIRGSDLGMAKIAVSVREGSGEEIIGIRSDALMIPASNLKLLTSGAALVALGPEFSFRTRLIRADDTLVIIGGGDPGFGDPELLALMAPRVEGSDASGGLGIDLDTFFGFWVDAVRESGMESVREIVVDDSVFDREYVHPTWPIDQLNRSYCAQVSGLTFHLNVVHFYPEPRPGGRPSMAAFDPWTGTLNIDNNATSLVAAHETDTVWIARAAGTNTMKVYGNVKHVHKAPLEVTVHDMPSLFGVMLAERLRAAGVSVDNVRLVEPAETPLKGTNVGPEISTPLATAITRCNRDSYNVYAECLLKRTGNAMTRQPGSWLNGAAIVRLIVHERLQNAALSSRLRIADGSGLSRDNRVAPGTMTAWLASFDGDEELGEIFINSLAVGGETGTLRKRSALTTANVSGALVQAKTGYINGVSCLSGYVTTPEGQRRCFSVMVNDITDGVPRAKVLQDRIVAAIAQSMQGAHALGGD